MKDNCYGRVKLGGVTRRRGWTHKEESDLNAGRRAVHCILPREAPPDAVFLRLGYRVAPVSRHLNATSDTCSRVANEDKCATHVKVEAVAVCL
jgi:hypothetical protein